MRKSCQSKSPVTFSRTAGAEITLKNDYYIDLTIPLKAPAQSRDTPGVCLEILTI